MLADMTDLAGREFFATSGNRGRVVLLGEHGCSVLWERYPPTSGDCDELKRWVMRLLNIPVENARFTEHLTGSSKEDHALYKAFLDEVKGTNERDKGEKNRFAEGAARKPEQAPADIPRSPGRLPEGRHRRTGADARRRPQG